MRDANTYVKVGSIVKPVGETFAYPPIITTIEELKEPLYPLQEVWRISDYANDHPVEPPDPPKCHTCKNIMLELSELYGPDHKCVSCIDYSNYEGIEPAKFSENVHHEESDSDIEENLKDEISKLRRRISELTYQRDIYLKTIEENDTKLEKLAQDVSLRDSIIFDIIDALTEYNADMASVGYIFKVIRDAEETMDRIEREKEKEGSDTEDPQSS